MRVINFFGGPGCGKSTVAAETFSLLKRANLKVELVTEFAKDIIWEGSTHVLRNDLYVLANQYHRLWRLRDQVDIVVTDSPLLLNKAYAEPRFHTVAETLFEDFENDNYLLLRSKPSLQYGRTQTEDAAIALDGVIKTFLIPYLYKSLEYDTASNYILTKYTN